MQFPPSPLGRRDGGEGERDDALIATGFYRLGVWDDEPSDPKQARYDGIDDIIATIGQSMLGLTFDCVAAITTRSTRSRKGLLPPRRLPARHQPLSRRRVHRPTSNRQSERECRLPKSPQGPRRKTRQGSNRYHRDRKRLSQAL